MPFEPPSKSLQIKLGGQSGVKKKFLTHFQFGLVFLKWLIFSSKWLNMAGIRISRTRSRMKLVDPSEEAQSSIYGGYLMICIPF